MGYCVDMDLYDVFIPHEKFDEALKAIKDLQNYPDQMGGGSWGPNGQVKRWYSWVGDVTSANTLKDALSEWRYGAEDDADGLYVAYFNGEKLGDDTILWKALAPFIKDGGVINCRGEDGEVWRWKFSGGKFHEQSGKIVYVDDD